MSSFIFALFLSVFSIVAFLDNASFSYLKIKKAIFLGEKSINNEKAILAADLLSSPKKAAFKRFKGESLKDLFMLIEIFGKEKVCLNKVESQISNKVPLYSRYTCTLNKVIQNSFFLENIKLEELHADFLSSKGEIEIKEAGASLIVAGGDILIKKATGTLYLFSGTGKISVENSTYPIYAKGKHGVPINSLEPPELLFKSNVVLTISPITSP